MKKKSKTLKTLYVEGTQDLDNGNLRKAFSSLLEKELLGEMPKIIMGDGIRQTVDKFMTKPMAPNEQRYLLIDSDEYLTPESRTTLISGYNESAKTNRVISLDENNTFFMVQEAEAWILSQPEVLKDFKVSTASLPKRNVMEISKPSEELSRLYRKSNKEYHKVSEFSKLFPKLDTSKLIDYFSEFDRLIKTLK